MTNVGSAEVSLSGNTAPFEASLRRAAGQFERFGQQLEGRLAAFDRQFAKGFGALAGRLQGIGRSLTTNLTLPLAAIGGGALVAGTKMDTLRRALEAVAGSTAEAERQMAELREVAKLPGLGLAEAVQGSVRLQAIGVSAETAARALKAFGNAIATTGGGKSELDRLTVQLGQLSAKGKILAQDLRPIIEAAPAVGKALRDAFGTVDAEEIQALGLSTDQFLDQLLVQLEKLPKVTGGAKNSFENLQTALLEAGDAVAKTFLPALTQLADRLSGFLTKLQDVNPNVIRWAVALGTVAAVAGPLLLIVGQLTVAAAALATALSVGLLPLLAVGGGILVGLGLLAAAFLKTQLEASGAERAIKAFADTLAGAGGSLEERQARLQARQQALISDVARLGRAYSVASGGLRNSIGRDLETARIQLGQVSKALREVEAQMLELQRLPPITVAAAIAPPGPDRSQRARPGEAFVAGVALPGLEAVGRNLELINQRVQAAMVSLTAFGESLLRIGLAGADALGDMGAALVQFVVEGGDRFEAFADRIHDLFHSFVQGALQDLARLAARMAIFEGLKLLFPGGGAFVTAFGVAAGLEGRQHGGPVLRNHAYLVGEAGPELFVPPVAGNIVPRGAMAGGGTLRLDTSSLPPRPPALTPDAVATDDWWRRAFSHLYLDHRERGGQR